MKNMSYTVLTLVVIMLAIPPVVALEVDREVAPRITVGGRIVSTIDYRNLDSETEQDDGFNLSDSTILMRFDKRLFSDGVAGATIGFKEDGEGDKKSVIMQELHAFYWNQNYAVTMGRTRLKNTLLEFPLLRDDDLIEYTHVGNASSNADDFDQLYGEQLSLDYFIDKKIQTLNLWGGTRVNGEGFDNFPNGFDSWGAAYVYQQPEDLRYVKRLLHAGLMYDRQKVTTASGNEWMYSLITGAEININENPLSNWSLGVQAIYNHGVEGIPVAEIANGATNRVANRAAAQSRSLVTSVRYTARPHLLTRWQSALTIAYKEYSDIPHASLWSIAPNMVYRIGQGVDLLSQLVYTEYSELIGNGHDTVFQVGIAFNFDTTFNDTIGERDSIINLEHSYIN